MSNKNGANVSLVKFVFDSTHISKIDELNKLYKTFIADKKFGKLFSLKTNKILNRIRADVYITFKCNYHCKYCYNKSRLYNLHDIDLDFIKKFIIKRNDINMPFEFVLSGGEPTLYTHLEYLCEFIRNTCKYDNVIRINSNGSSAIDVYKNLFKYNASFRIAYHDECNLNHLYKLIDVFEDNNINYTVSALLNIASKSTIINKNKILSELINKYETKLDISLCGDYIYDIYDDNIISHATSKYSNSYHTLKFEKCNLEVNDYILGYFNMHNNIFNGMYCFNKHKIICRENYITFMCDDNMKIYNVDSMPSMINNKYIKCDKNECDRYCNYVDIIRNIDDAIQ